MPPQKQNEIGQTEKNKNKGKIGPGRHAIKTLFTITDAQV